MPKQLKHALLQAAPGIYIIKRLEEKFQVNTGQGSKKSIIMGEVLSVGLDRQHDDGGEMKSYAKEGDTVAFFSYMEGSDIFELKNEQYYCVVFNDLRAVLKEVSDDDKN